jgi:hypothetical protein
MLPNKYLRKKDNYCANVVAIRQIEREYRTPYFCKYLYMAIPSSPAYIYVHTLTVAMETPSGGVAGGIQYSCI